MKHQILKLNSYVYLLMQEAFSFNITRENLVVHQETSLTDHVLYSPNLSTLQLMY